MEHKYKLKEFNTYCEEFRNRIKEKLEHDVSIDFNQFLAEHDIVERNKTKECYYRMVEFAQKIRENEKMVLETPAMLDVFLDSVVRRQIVIILNSISFYPSTIVDHDKLIRVLYNSGFSDALEYVNSKNFEKVDDVREDFYRQLGFEFIPFTDLKEDKLEAEANQDEERLKINELLWIKSCIDKNFWNYRDTEFDLFSVAEMPYEYLEILARKNKNISK